MKPWHSPLAFAFAVQAATSVADASVPVLGPFIAAGTGASPALVGLFFSAVSLGAVVFFLLGSGLVHRFGAPRVLRAGAVVTAAGLLAALSGSAWLILAAGLVVGLGFGVNGPAGAVLLHDAVPERRRRLAFSLKQVGMPVGATLAGLCLPAIAARWGWQAALLATSGLCLAVALLLRVRPAAGSESGPDPAGAGPGGTPPWLDLRALGGLAAQRRIGRLLAAGALLAVAQGSVYAFLVVYLVEGLGLSPLVAGGLYSLFHLAGIPGRIATGWLADRPGLRSWMLSLIGLASAGGLVGLAILPAGAALPLVAAAVIALGLVVGSWNGILTVEATEAAPPGRVAEAAGVAATGAFAGFLAGPLVFAEVLQLGGGYQAALLAVAASAALAPAILPRDRSPSQTGAAARVGE
ncbi:Cyanate permease [Tistlia consotensis]|uniref:Cyanate permease n=1 Tax=Tistlia consotensis USBA 355 TaxID=560819 RepID=A0A1Y6CPQ0_9PROT|nr:MFS transporter [Tistlia consotensis]SMF82108.1 Cyanate permease [Tistlia consotensis USBA 355]SNS25479.1 Cyanate permease [Tistlia consotensis]